MALRSTQPLTEKRTRNLFEGKGRPAGASASQPYRHLSADFVENVEASASHNPRGLHKLSQE
jgi:hypothetical protein